VRGHRARARIVKRNRSNCSSHVAEATGCRIHWSITRTCPSLNRWTRTETQRHGGDTARRCKSRLQTRGVRPGPTTEMPLAGKRTGQRRMSVGPRVSPASAVSAGPGWAVDAG
jgi:hypothetical protein